MISKDWNKILSALWMMYGETSYGRHTAQHQLQWSSEVKLNLKEFLQKQWLLTERETWAILRSFGYSSLISDPDMICWGKPEKNICNFLTFDKAVDLKTDKYQNGPRWLKKEDLEQETKPFKTFWLFRIYSLILKDWNKIQSALWMMYGETSYGHHTAQHQLQWCKMKS